MTAKNSDTILGQKISVEEAYSMEVSSYLNRVGACVEWLKDFAYTYPNEFAPQKLNRALQKALPFFEGFTQRLEDFNGDKYFDFVDSFNDFFESLLSVKDFKQFDEDLEKCIIRQGTKPNQPVEINERIQHQSTHPLWVFQNIVEYCFYFYSKLAEGKTVHGNILYSQHYNRETYNALAGLIREVYKRTKTPVNGHICNSIENYIVAKCDMPNNIVLDQQIEMIINKQQ